MFIYLLPNILFEVVTSLHDIRPFVFIFTQYYVVYRFSLK